jgi:hypothetical protein
MDARTSSPGRATGAAGRTADAVALLVAKQGHEKPVRGCRPGRHPFGPFHQADPEAQHVDRRGKRARSDLAHERGVQGDVRMVGGDPAQTAEDLEANPAVALRQEMPLQRPYRLVGREEAERARDVLADPRRGPRVEERLVQGAQRLRRAPPAPPAPPPQPRGCSASR